LPETVQNRDDIHFIYNPMANTIIISINNIDSEEFDIEEMKLETILEYINLENSDKTTFIVN